MKSQGTHPGQKAKVAPDPAFFSYDAFFCLFAGFWVGLSLLKFGNPIILDRLVSQPKFFIEILLESWPVKWGYALTTLLLIAGVRLVKVQVTRRMWPIGLLLLWFFWALLSNTRSIDPRLSNPTMVHFAFCLIAFFIGFAILSNCRRTEWFWIPVILAFAYVLFLGFDQHNGGLEETRKAFYAQPDWQTYPKEFLAKIETNRIFASLVYPNALAGAILLFLPVLLWRLWSVTERWPRVLRAVVTGLYAYLGVADLYWTGSKGGWLIAVILMAVLFLHLNVSRQLKWVLVTLGLVLGLTAFGIKFSSYFKKGAPSVGARFVYWQAALDNTIQHPIFGSGPGTFQVVFSRVKTPEAEMARLVHNDYLEQSSDSGIIAFLSFFGFFSLSLAFLYRYRNKTMLPLLIWLGLLGYALQSFIEFALYIPALAWPVFLFFGWLWGSLEINKKIIHNNSNQP